MKRVILKPIISLIMIAVAGGLVMLLWNAVIPAVVGWGAVSYLQAVGLLLLSRILFGGWDGVKQRAAVAMHPNSRDVRERVKGMSKEQKREYIRAYMSDEGGEAK